MIDYYHLMYQICTIIDICHQQQYISQTFYLILSIYYRQKQQTSNNANGGRVTPNERNNQIRVKLTTLLAEKLMIN